MKLVSVYSHYRHSGTDTKGQSAPTDMDIDIILDSIKTGVYEKSYPLAQIRLAKANFRIEEERCQDLSKEEIAKDEKYQKAYNILTDLKNKIPRITVAGTFKPEGRSEANLKTPSELIDIDIDKIDDIDSLQEKLSNDPYTYAVFKSCGGDGLALLFRIDPRKHKEAYEGIQHYLYEHYGLSIDAAHKNPANTRNLSYDPNCFFLSKYPPVFKEYLKKKKEEPKLSFVYGKTDFEECIKQIVGQQLDFCPNYETYRDIGFAISNKFGLHGLEYFNDVCQFGEKYNREKLVKHYKALCRNPEGKVKIATFFYRCKELKLELYSKETKMIASYASAALRSGRTKEDVIKNLDIHEGLTKDKTEDIVNQVFDDKIEFISQSGILDDIESYLKINYQLKVNEITGKFENNGEEWSEADFNSCLIDVKKAFDKADAKWTERILFSSQIVKYNPLRQFFEDNKDKMPVIKMLEGRPQIPDIICKLWDSVKTRSAAYTEKFGTKWLVGAVATWNGEPSNLELIFAGQLEKGKTHFIRNILPPELKRYYAECKIDGTDNSNVMMCQKAIINQNECGGRNKNSDDIHKDVLDKEVFSQRRPYRRDPEDMPRICAPFGTTNKISDVLTDRLGNRRIIVTEVISRDFDAYDAIDKTELWMAVYALWKAGYKWKILGNDIIELNSYSSAFEAHELEYEMICKFFQPCDLDDRDNLKFTASDIKDYIESRSTQKLKSKLVIEELYRMKYNLVSDTVNGLQKKFYNIKLNLEVATKTPDMPF